MGFSFPCPCRGRRPKTPTAGKCLPTAPQRYELLPVPPLRRRCWFSFPPAGFAPARRRARPQRSRGCGPVAPGVGWGRLLCSGGGQPRCRGLTLGCCPRLAPGRARFPFPPAAHRGERPLPRGRRPPGRGAARLPGPLPRFRAGRPPFEEKGTRLPERGNDPVLQPPKPAQRARGRQRRASSRPPGPPLSRRPPRPGTGTGTGTARSGRRAWPSPFPWRPRPALRPPARPHQTWPPYRPRRRRAPASRRRGGASRTGGRSPLSPLHPPPCRGRGLRPIGAGSSPVEGAVPAARGGGPPIGARRGRGGGRSGAGAGRPRRCRRHRPRLPLLLPPPALPCPARPGPARGSAPTPGCPEGLRPGAGRGRRAGRGCGLARSRPPPAPAPPSCRRR